jgi:hypothetical protein
MVMSVDFGILLICGQMLISFIVFTAARHLGFLAPHMRIQLVPGRQKNASSAICPPGTSGCIAL